MCHSCHVAKTNPDSGLYSAECRGCEIRALSKAPRFVREDAYAKLDPGQRAATAADVNAEFTRRETLRRSLGM